MPRGDLPPLKAADGSIGNRSHLTIPDFGDCRTEDGKQRAAALALTRTAMRLGQLDALPELLRIIGAR